MPFFRSTYNILTKADEDEVFNENWMDSNKVVVPPKKDWTYDREMQIEDVDIWEILYEAGGGLGVYASWCPYAEFYLITTGGDYRNDGKLIDGILYHGRNMETYYGPGAQQKVQKRCAELNIKLRTEQVWVDPDKMWLHQQPQQPTKTIILPDLITSNRS